MLGARATGIGASWDERPVQTLSSDESQRTANVLWPLLASTLAADCASFSFQSANTTEAPDSANALAVARPSPDAAPGNQCDFVFKR
jgi:hypothetical protein